MQLTTPQFEKITRSVFLVTGGAGFIGSHIAEFLLNAGARKVRILDNLSTGHFRNVAPFANHPGFEFLNGDICDVNTCKAACQGVDYVFHQAALGSDRESIKDGIATTAVNVSGFFNILAAAQMAGVKRFVFASNDYVHTTGEGYGMEAIGLRYFNVFGQRQHPQSAYAAVIPQFVKQLVKHESPVINGTEEYAHDFNFIENVVQANMLALFNTDARALNQEYHIAFEERPSLHQVATCLKEFLCVFDESIAEVDIIYEPRLGNNADSFAMVEKAKELLGYRPRYTLREGLLQSVSWYWTFLPQFELEDKEKKQRIVHSDTVSI